MDNRVKRRRRGIVLIFALSLFLIVWLQMSLSNYYKATGDALSYIEDPAEGITVEYKENTIVFAPENPEAAFIFYPGGLVQSEAYAPMLEQLAENGIECILVEMPYYLAIFDANGARGIQAKYPEIDNWYIGGHSLGGVMASLYAHRHVPEYEGLVLLGSYSTKDFSQEDLDILLVRGSEDKVLKMDKYQENLKNLPEDYTEIVIDGGCHAYFGDYGKQSGDGQPSITVEEQITDTVEAITEFIER